MNRALEKLRKFFTKRGVSSTTAIIAGTISANSVQAAPVALAKSVTAVAIAKGAAASGSTLTLIKGALKLMAWSKAKTAVITGVVVLLAAGTATVAIREIQKNAGEEFQWQNEKFMDSQWLDEAPPLLKIVPTKFPNMTSAVMVGDNNRKWKEIGFGYDAKAMIENVYGSGDARTICLTNLSKERYDFIVTESLDGQEKFQAELQKRFGVTAQFELKEKNVLLLTLKNPNANGLRPGTSGGTSRRLIGEFSYHNYRIIQLASDLESLIRIPVIDQTGLTNHFDIDLKWKQLNWEDANLEGLKRALLDQLGIELVPTNMPIKMLVIEKAQ